jgi:hypothetical protein
MSKTPLSLPILQHVFHPSDFSAASETALIVMSTLDFAPRLGSVEMNRYAEPFGGAWRSEGSSPNADVFGTSKSDLQPSTFSLLTAPVSLESGIRDRSILLTGC